MTISRLPPPRSKPKLFAAPRPAPSPKVALMPPPGSFGRLRLSALRRIANNPIASWALGVAALAAIGSSAYAFWGFLLRAGTNGAPWVDQAFADSLGMSAGLAEQARSGRLGQAGLGLCLALGSLLALRWAAWAAFDLPMLFGAFAARKGSGKPASAFEPPLSPLSWGSAGLHLLCAALLAACVVHAGKIDLDSLDAMLTAKARPALADAGPAAR